MNLENPDLTGRVGFRFGVFGKLVVQIEHRKPSESPGTFECFWKDASINDLLRALTMDKNEFVMRLQR